MLITLLATLSSEIPNVLLSRHDLTAGPDGKFQAIVPIAPDYMRDSFINVLATSSPGVTSASSQLLIHAANAGITSPGGNASPAESGNRETHMLHSFISMVRDEEGATMVEYGLLVALIALVALAAVTTLGTNLSTLFNNTANTL